MKVAIIIFRFVRVTSPLAMIIYPGIAARNKHARKRGREWFQQADLQVPRRLMLR